ncbi:MAG: hypothetical protein G01um1014106_34 [Parcubacteria group bacterium Gr01-1014_106]|nr:MAG: hypothetical protein G01um1014106_34 [Parcubacteria group bacterium Gr01-1014_106]
MRVLVTGGTGFIGSNLALHLHAQGHEVWITGTTGEQDLPELRERVLPREFWALDWKKLGTLDVVFHQAANNDTTDLDRENMFRVNVDGSLKLFQDAVAHGCARIVYAASCAVYGDVPAPYREDGPVHPLNPYAESKLALDERAMAFAAAHQGVTVVGLRYSNVFGPREGHKSKRATMITQFAQQMREGNPRLFKFGEQKRDYIYVDDVVRANMLAAEARTSAVVNCGSGTATAFNDLVALLNAVLGTQRVPEYIENPYAGRYQEHTECDMTRAKQLLGFVPAFDIRAGIRAYAETGLLASSPAQLATHRRS